MASRAFFEPEWRRQEIAGKLHDMMEDVRVVPWRPWRGIVMFMALSDEKHMKSTMLLRPRRLSSTAREHRRISSTAT